MSAEPLLPVYLVTGNDGPKVSRALRRLRSRFADESVDLLSADIATGEDAVAACNALGLFGGADGGRLVVVDGAERWKKPDVDAVAEYLRDPVPGAVLALVAAEPLRSDALAKAVTGAGRVLAYDAPRPRDLPAWVRSQVGGLGGAIDADAARALVEIVGDDLVALATEADKLTTWARGQPIERSDVEALATPAREAAAWALTDSWGSRDADALLAAAEAELEKREPFAIASRLASHVVLVRSVKLASEEGAPARDISKRTKIHEFRIRKALAHAERYSSDELDAAVVRLAALDAALKGGSRVPGDVELTRALVDLVAADETPARRTA